MVKCMERIQEAVFRIIGARFLSQIITKRKNSQKNIGREQHHEVHYESSRKKHRKNYDDVR